MAPIIPFKNKNNNSGQFSLPFSPSHFFFSLSIPLSLSLSLSLSLIGEEGVLTLASIKNENSALYLSSPVRERERDKEKEGGKERERERESRKCGRALSVPHSVSHSACVIIILILHRRCC
jgi:hypothetical protein